MNSLRGLLYLGLRGPVLHPHLHGQRNFGAPAVGDADHTGVGLGTVLNDGIGYYTHPSMLVQNHPPLRLIVCPGCEYRGPGDDPQNLTPAEYLEIAVRPGDINPQGTQTLHPHSMWAKRSLGKTLSIQTY